MQLAEDEQVLTGRGRRMARILAVPVLTAIIAALVWFAHVSRQPPVSSDRELSLQMLLDSNVEQLRVSIDELKNRPGQESVVALLQGIVHLRTDALEDAVGELQSAVSDPGLRITALSLLGEAYYRQGRYLDAERALNQSVTIDPRQTGARRLLAATYYDMGAVQLAMDHLAIVAQQDPTDPRPNRLRGLIQKDFERYQLAIDEYRESLRRDPNPPDRPQILLELATCQAALHNFDEALETLSSVVPSADSLALEGRCALALSRPEDAAKFAAEALQRDPRHGGALLLQAQLRLNAGETDAARELLERTVAVAPEEFEPRYQLANVYRRLGKTEAAEQQLQQVKRLQDLRVTFTELHKQAFSDTQDADLRCRIGAIALDLNKPELAEIWFRAALAIDPEHANARESLQAMRTPLPKNTASSIAVPNKASIE